MSEFAVLCGIHGDVLEVGGECSVCTLVERNQLKKDVTRLINIANEQTANCDDQYDRTNKAEAERDKLRDYIHKIEFYAVESYGVNDTSAAMICEMAAEALKKG